MISLLVSAVVLPLKLVLPFEPPLTPKLSIFQNPVLVQTTVSGFSLQKTIEGSQL